MLVTYLRSSSINTHTMCEMQYYLRYVLGLPDSGNFKADKGNVLHKAAEIFARKKKAIQDGMDHYVDEIFGKVRLSDITVEWAVNKSFNHYKKLSPQHPWAQRDYNDCLEWTHKLFEMNDGLFHPMNCDVVEPEKTFDITIDKPWARYDFLLPDGQRLQGNLAIKGTVDLVVREEDDFYGVVDYKSGKRLDWATGQEKTYKKLRDDHQLLLYFYAMTHTYPEINHFLITIVYVNSGGAFSISYSRSDLDRAEAMIRRKFERIVSVKKPVLNKSWKCTKLCSYGRSNQPNTEKTICEHFKTEVQKKDADKVFYEIGNVKALTSYGSGGGRTNKDETKS